MSRFKQAYSVCPKSLLLQESDEDESGQDQQTNTGRVPRTITCFVDRDLVDSCVPGDFVQVCGVVSLLSASPDMSVFYSASNRRPLASAQDASSGKTNVFNLCIRANNLSRIYSRAGDDGGDCSIAVQCLTTRRQDSHNVGKINAENCDEFKAFQMAGADSAAFLSPTLFFQHL